MISPTTADSAGKASWSSDPAVSLNYALSYLSSKRLRSGVPAPFTTVNDTVEVATKSPPVTAVTRQ